MMQDQRTELERLRRLRELEERASGGQRQQRGREIAQTFDLMGRADNPIGQIMRFTPGGSALPAVQRVLQGFNVSDEAVGGIARMGGGDYEAARTTERDRVERDREERPVTTFLEEAGAGALLGGGAVGAARSAAPQLARGMGQFAASRPITTGVMAGGATGSASGYGAGETPSERRFGAVTGGLAGAGLGGAIPAMAPLARRGMSAARRALGQQIDDTPQAVRQFFRHVPEETRNELAESAGEGGPEFLGERLGARGERIMTDLAQGDDPAANFARAAARQRAEARSGRVMSEVQLRTGSRRGVGAIADRQQAEAAARPIFRQVDETPVAANGRLRELVRRAASENVNIGGTASRQPRGELRLDSLLSDDPVEGALSGQTVRSLIADVQDAKNTAFRQGGGNAGTRLRDLERELRGFLGDEVPAFRQASQMWRDARLDDEAFRLGTSVFDEGKNRAFVEADLRDFVGNMDDMSASERGQFLSGVLDAIERRTGSTTQGGNAGSRLTRDGIRDRLSIVFGTDADALSDILSREGYTASLDRMYDPMIGPQTAARQASAGAANEALRGQGSRYAGELVQDTKGATLGRARQALSRAISEASPAERERLSRLMFAPITDDELSRQLSQMIQRERRRAGLFGGGAAYGGMIAGQQPSRQ